MFGSSFKSSTRSTTVAYSLPFPTLSFFWSFVYCFWNLILFSSAYCCITAVTLSEVRVVPFNLAKLALASAGELAIPSFAFATYCGLLPDALAKELICCVEALPFSL